MNWERFANAPIAEALLDIQVSFPSPVEPGRLEAFHDAIRDHYPTREARVKWQGQIVVEREAVQQAVRRDSEGFMFKAADGRRLVQVRQDGFTFNWLKPYERWAALRDEAREHWQRYRDTFGPDRVTRLGLRYMNRIEIPLPFNDFREYVETAPDIAKGLPQGVSALFMRLEIPDGARRLLAIITETIQPVLEDPARLPFIFDIDVVREASYRPEDPAIWEAFEGMREYKNEIFFRSVTPRAKELFR